MDSPDSGPGHESCGHGPGGAEARGAPVLGSGRGEDLSAGDGPPGRLRARTAHDRGPGRRVARDLPGRARAAGRARTGRGPGHRAAPRRRAGTGRSRGMCHALPGDRDHGRRPAAACGAGPGPGSGPGLDGGGGERGSGPGTVHPLPARRGSCPQRQGGHHLGRAGRDPDPARCTASMRPTSTWAPAACGPVRSWAATAASRHSRRPSSRPVTRSPHRVDATANPADLLAKTGAACPKYAPGLALGGSQGLSRMVNVRIASNRPG